MYEELKDKTKVIVSKAEFDQFEKRKAALKALEEELGKKLQEFNEKGYERRVQFRIEVPSFRLHKERFIRSACDGLIRPDSVRNVTESYVNDLPFTLQAQIEQMRKISKEFQESTLSAKQAVSYEMKKLTQQFQDEMWEASARLKAENDEVNRQLEALKEAKNGRSLMGRIKYLFTGR